MTNTSDTNCNIRISTQNTPPENTNSSRNTMHFQSSLASATSERTQHTTGRVRSSSSNLYAGAHATNSSRVTRKESVISKKHGSSGAADDAPIKKKPKIPHVINTSDVTLRNIIDNLRTLTSSGMYDIITESEVNVHVNTDDLHNKLLKNIFYIQQSPQVMREMGVEYKKLREKIDKEADHYTKGDLKKLMQSIEAIVTIDVDEDKALDPEAAKELDNISFLEF